MLFDGERDACGVGFVAHIKGERSRAIIDQGLEVLRRLSHRAACGADPETGGQVGLAGAGRAEEHDVVLVGDEVQGAQVRDEVAF